MTTDVLPEAAQIDSHESSIIQPRALSYIEFARLVFDIRNRLVKNIVSDDPMTARKAAKIQAESFFIKLQEQHGINLKASGFGKLKVEDVPLVFGNHQPIGFESLCIYGLLPPKFRVVLKDSLIKTDNLQRKMLGIGAGLQKLDPIPYVRGDDIRKRRAAANECGQAVADTIRSDQDEGHGHVVLFPEGKRSANGQLLRLRPSLMDPGIRAVQALPEEARNIGVLTTDSCNAFPFKPEEKDVWLGRKKAYRQPISVRFDVIPITPDQTTKEVREAVAHKLGTNLALMSRGEFDLPNTN